MSGCAATHSLANLPVVDQSPPSSERPQQNGCNYIELDVSSQPVGPFDFGFSGAPGIDWSVDVMHISPGATTTAESMDLDSQEQGSLSVAADRL